VVIVAWRDIASPQAGGSELLVDQLATGLIGRGDRVTLLCGGPSAAHGYEVVRSGGPYTQFLGAPFAYWRRLRDCDVVVEVCNGMPFLAPLWSRKPMICMVNHVHTDLWPLRFRPPLSTAGRFMEQRVMPSLHRRNLVLTVSASTARELESLGVPRERIRMLTNGAAPAGPPVPRCGEPQFLALGRLAEYKRIDLLLRLWDRVRPVVGGRLVIAGDGPQRSYLESLAGPGVSFTGRVSEEEKHRLLGAAWLLLHPAQIEGWGIVITEAALRARGLRTGLYSSPHLNHFCERIRLDGTPISEERACELLEEVRSAVPWALADPGLTFFEIVTLMAFLAFREVDAMVIEVGLGGRLDATNVVRPRACAVSALGLEHTQYLGPTLARVAAECVVEARVGGATDIPA